MTGWCILQMTAARTLTVTRFLREAGFDVWTPSATMRTRWSRSRKFVDREKALLPNFAFARAEDLPQLLAIAHSPRSDHPPFSVLHRRNGQPYVGNINLGPLREYEAKVRAEWKTFVDALEREAKLKTKKSRARTYVLGQRVKVDKPAFAGLVGEIVEKRKNGDLVLEFAGFTRGAVVPSCDVESIQLDISSSEQDKAA